MITIYTTGHKLISRFVQPENIVIDISGGGGGGAVASVNGQTGTVNLTASDVGAMPSGYVAPVQSVNGQTGAVNLTIPDAVTDAHINGLIDAKIPTIPTALPNPHALTINGTSYDGSKDVEVTVSGGGGSSSGGTTLLWTNPNPSATFAAQTVNVAKYDWYLLHYSHTNTTNRNTVLIKYGESNVMPIVTTSSNRNANRTATPGTSGIAFSACTYNGSTTNTYAVPLEIYGLNW